MIVLLLGACAGGPRAPDWQLNASQSLQAFQRLYFAGDTQAAEREFRQARTELARTGKPELVARAELVRCAVRASSLEFDDCPGFERLRADADESAREYADYLAGRGQHAVREEDPLSRLVAYAVRLRSGTISPSDIAAAVELASDAGWRRPLLAWLGLQSQRADAAGEVEAAARLRRRMQLITE